MKSEDGSLYPHNVMIYNLPPTQDITLQAFEEYANERVNLLRIFKQASEKKLRVLLDGWKEEIKSEMQAAGMTSYLSLIGGHSQTTPDDLFARKKDYISHFILRLAYCRSADLQKWFVAREVDWFKLKFSSLEMPEMKQYLEFNNLNFHPITEDEKSALKVSWDDIEIGKLFKVHFTNVPDLIRTRRCHVKDGCAYVAVHDFGSIVAGLQEACIEMGLAAAAQLRPDLNDDERVVDFVKRLHTSYTGRDELVTVNASIPIISTDRSLEKSLPLDLHQCLEHLEFHRKYRGRLQHGIFFNGIGVSLGDSLRFWRTEYTRMMDLGKFEKSNAYDNRIYTRTTDANTSRAKPTAKSHHQSNRADKTDLIDQASGILKHTFAMASDDNKTCPMAKKAKIDASTEHFTVQELNAQFPKIDNLEYFPEKVLLHIFSKVNDKDLLHLSEKTYRFEQIARIVFKDKYTDKYFVFNDVRQQETYEELFSRFGRYADIRAVKVKNIDHINQYHWLIQLLRQYTNHLQKLTIEDCSIENIGETLAEHLDVEHLVVRDIYTEVEYRLPGYRNLKTLNLDAGEDIVLNLEETIQNNPALESLILDGSEFTLHEMMMMIAMYLKHLTELHLTYFAVEASRFNDDWIRSSDMDLIIDSLKNLHSLKLTLTNGQFELIQRIGCACESLRLLALQYSGNDNFSDPMFDALCQCTTIEHFEFTQFQYNEQIESVVDHLPNLRRLDLFIDIIPQSSTFILSLLHKCPSIEAITIQTESSLAPEFFVNAQFWDEFNAAMQHPNGKAEVKSFRKVIGYVTKKEIVWNNIVHRLDSAKLLAAEKL